MDNQEYYSFSSNNQAFVRPKIKNDNHLIKGIIFLALALILIGGTIAAAYFTKSWPFSNIGAAQLFEQAIEKAKTINSAYYDFSVEIKSTARDANIKQFEYSDPNYQSLMFIYQRDNARLDNANNIIDKLITYKNLHKKYPKTLVEAGIVAQDPAGQIYPYTSTDKDFSFKITFEIKEIPEFFIDMKYSKVDVNGQELTFHPLSYVEIGNLTPPKPLLVTAYDGLSKVASWVPNNFSLSGKVSGSIEKGATSGSDAMFKIGGNLTLEDLIMNVELESLEKGQDLYVKINALPGIPGINVSELKQKWIKIVPEDLNNFSSYLPLSEEVSPSQEVLLSTQNQLKTILRIAKEESLIKLKGEPIKEVIDNEKVYHYQLEINKEKVAIFYQKAANELERQYKEKALFKFDQQIFEELISQSTLNLIDYINQSISVNLYISRKTGYPIKGSIAVTAIPPADSQKTNQIVLSFNLVLSNINKGINVDIPKEFITIEDADIIIQGISRGEYLLKKQEKNLLDIGSALGKFRNLAGRYPDFLDQLKMNTADIKKLNVLSTVSTSTSSLYYPTIGNETKPLLTGIPVDVFTKQPYGYSKTSDDNYRLNYQMTLPTYQKGSRPSSRVYMYNPYGTAAKNIIYLNYVSGTNTKDKSIPSLEAGAQSKIDTDKDQLSDTLELYLGTDPNSKDTDKDSYLDGEELKSGYDPLSSGMLQ